MTLRFTKYLLIAALTGTGIPVKAATSVTLQ